MKIAEAAWVRGFVASIAWMRRHGHTNDSDVVMCMRQNGLAIAEVRQARVDDFDLSVIEQAWAKQSGTLEKQEA